MGGTHLSIVEVRGAEVDEDVGEEHDVDDEVDDDERVRLLRVRVREPRRRLLQPRDQTCEASAK